MGLNVTDTVINNVWVNLKYWYPFLCWFFLFTTSSLNKQRFYWQCRVTWLQEWHHATSILLGRDGFHTTSRDFLMAQHRSMLKIMPNTCNTGQRRAALSVHVSWCALQQLKQSKTYQNNADGYSHSAYNVELGVKHIFDGIGAALQNRRRIPPSFPKSQQNVTYGAYSRQR